MLKMPYSSYVGLVKRRGSLAKDVSLRRSKAMMGNKPQKVGCVSVDSPIVSLRLEHCHKLRCTLQRGAAVNANSSLPPCSEGKRSTVGKTVTGLMDDGLSIRSNNSNKTIRHGRDATRLLGYKIATVHRQYLWAARRRLSGTQTFGRAPPLALIERPRYQLSLRIVRISAASQGRRIERMTEGGSDASTRRW